MHSPKVCSVVTRTPDRAPCTLHRPELRDSFTGLNDEVPRACFLMSRFVRISSCGFEVLCLLFFRALVSTALRLHLLVFV